MGKFLGTLVGLAIIVQGFLGMGPAGPAGRPTAIATIEAESEAAGVVADATFAEASAAVDETPQPVEVKPRLLVFTQAGCDPCVTQKNNLARIKDYKVGDTPDADIQIVNTSDGGPGREQGKLFKITGFPCCVMIGKGNVETGRRYGPQSAAGLEQWLKTTRTN